MAPATTTAALVPVRALCDAKRRLATALDAVEREQLALAMLRDMLEALALAPSLARAVVISADRGLLTEAERLGADTLLERRPRGLNAAVGWAALQLQRCGVSSLLTIPGDVPLLGAAEVERLLAVDSSRYPVVLVPSASGTGTNALLTTPPSIITPAFEGASLEAHAEACRRRGIAFLTLALPGFALDVDTPADLLDLARHGAGRSAGRLALHAVERRGLGAQARATTATPPRSVPARSP